MVVAVDPWPCSSSSSRRRSRKIEKTSPHLDKEVSMLVHDERRQCPPPPQYFDFCFCLGTDVSITKPRGLKKIRGRGARLHQSPTLQTDLLDTPGSGGPVSIFTKSGDFIVSDDFWQEKGGEQEEREEIR